jgi:aerobic-type carbon monoxide dehydrogenase small subunit (CoxS/CutS family)
MTPVSERPAVDAPESGAEDIAVSRIDVSSEALLDYLREHLRLHGTKKGCDQGACSARTVLVDDRRVLSCLALAIQYDGRPPAVRLCR